MLTKVSCKSTVNNLHHWHFVCVICSVNGHVRINHFRPMIRASYQECECRHKYRESKIVFRLLFHYLWFFSPLCFSILSRQLGPKKLSGRRGKNYSQISVLAPQAMVIIWDQQKLKDPCFSSPIGNILYKVFTSSRNKIFAKSSSANIKNSCNVTEMFYCLAHEFFHYFFENFI